MKGARQVSYGNKVTLVDGEQILNKKNLSPINISYQYNFDVLFLGLKAFYNQYELPLSFPLSTVYKSRQHQECTRWSLLSFSHS